MADKIKGRNDQERLLFISKTYGSTAKIPKSEISSSSEDGLTVITVQGTKVNDELIAQAVKEDGVRKAAASAVAGVQVEGLSKDQVQGMIDEAIKKALNNPPPPPK